MNIKIEYVELNDGQFTLFCSACMNNTRYYYIVGREIICRGCVDELHLHLLNTRKLITSLPNGDDGGEVKVECDHDWGHVIDATALGQGCYRPCRICGERKPVTHPGLEVEGDQHDSAAIRKIIEGSQSASKVEDYVLKGHEVCPKCGQAHTGGPGGNVCAACQYPTKPGLSLGDGIEWGLSQGDAL